MSQKSNTADAHFFMAVHVLITFFIVAFIASSHGCTEEEELEPNLGKAYSFNDVQGVLRSATSQSLPINMKVDDAVLYETNIRVATGQISKMQEMLSYVDAIQDMGLDLEIAYSDVVYEYDNTGDMIKEHPPKQSVLRVKKDNPPIPIETLGVAMNQAQSLSFDGSMTKSQLIQSYQDLHPNSEVVDITFHNLKVQKIKVKPPLAVRNKTNCMDIPNCQLSATQINFKTAYWLDNGNKEIYNVSIRGTNDTPAYLGAWLSECRTGMFSLQQDDSNKILLTICNVLRDFKFGQ